ncbi:MAG: lipoyl synthase [Candidatus Poseidoniales archaeon]|nr:MAG: lipoyl synthase [Candidatus Poseidoniales archaeon]
MIIVNVYVLFEPIMVPRLPTVESSEEVNEEEYGIKKMTAIEKRKAIRKRLPEWFKTSLPVGEAQKKFNQARDNVREHGLNTVCEEARCPNIHDCWGRGTATFMIAGEVCTRGCKFCAVGTVKKPDKLDENEPKELADSIKRMGLKYAVITVVNRDDLEDGGARHYKNCIIEVKKENPDIGLELLCSDLDGNIDALEMLLEELPLKVFAHNVECVPRLDSKVRDSRASFEQSLEILKMARKLRPDIKIKSSLMVGLGETDEEIVETMKLLKSSGVDMITLGQYLQPSYKHLPVSRFPEPEKFAIWDGLAREIGFKAVASGPLVRSSYRAGLLYEESNGGMPVAIKSSTGSAVTNISYHNSNKKVITK